MMLRDVNFPYFSLQPFTHNFLNLIFAFLLLVNLFSSLSYLLFSISLLVSIHQNSPPPVYFHLLYLYLPPALSIPVTPQRSSFVLPTSDRLIPFGSSISFITFPYLYLVSFLLHLLSLSTLALLPSPLPSHTFSLPYSSSYLFPSTPLILPILKDDRK